MTILIWSISLACIILMLVRPRGIAEVYWISGGAIVLAVSGLVPLDRVAFALRQGGDVYLFLAGMMVLAELAREEGVFNWISGLALRWSEASRFRLFFLVYLCGTIITALLSNDATAVVLTPAVLAVLKKSRVDARPYIFACALAANSASFLFTISNPANLIVFHHRMPSLAQWLDSFLPASLVAIAVTFLLLWAIYHASLRGDFEHPAGQQELASEGKLALAGLGGAAALLITASALGIDLGLPACAAALLAMGAVAWKDPRGSARAALKAPWSILPLVGSLFVVIEALQGAGLLHLGSLGLRWLEHAPQPLGRLVAGFAVALLSNGLNNLPVGLAGAAMIEQAQSWAHPSQQWLSHAILLGVDLGPNLSVSGSLATILWLLVLRREGEHVTAWEFFRNGVVVMPLVLAASLMVVR